MARVRCLGEIALDLRDCGGLVAGRGGQSHSEIPAPLLRRAGLRSAGTRPPKGVFGIKARPPALSRVPRPLRPKSQSSVPMHFQYIGAMPAPRGFLIGSPRI